VLQKNEGLINDFLNNTTEDAGKKLQNVLASEIQAAQMAAQTQEAKINIVANVEGEAAQQ
jgi:hypothetical protein